MMHAEGQQTKAEQGLKESDFLPLQGLPGHCFLRQQMLPLVTASNAQLRTTGRCSNLLQRCFVELCGNHAIADLHIAVELPVGIVQWNT